jgi:type II secretion system protein J
MKVMFDNDAKVIRGMDFDNAAGGRSARSAFTLIEVLMALVICAIVLVAMSTVFATALHLRDKTANALDESLPINQGLAILEKDVKGAVGPGGITQGDFKCNGQGMGETMGLSAADRNGMDFFTTTGVINDRNPWGDIQEVYYELVASEGGKEVPGRDLVRYVSPNILSTTTTRQPEMQRLMSKVENITFECYDGSSWKSTWDTNNGDTNLPVAVRVSVQMSVAEGEDLREMHPYQMVIPIAINCRTNMTDTVTAQ